MSEPVSWFDGRRDDWRRHVVDLQERGYEGATTRDERELVFQRAFERTTPIALRVLEDLDRTLLGGEASMEVSSPREVGPDELEGRDRTPTGGLLGWWSIAWPALERAHSRFGGRPLPPVAVFAMFPRGFTHPHLALFDLGEPRRWIACWPFQVLDAADAERQAGVIAAIAEADLHERTFAGDLNWRLLDLEARHVR